MRITQLSLTSFRNYESLEFFPHDRANVLVGPNAQGKSALLEAMYLLSTSKSHRTNRDSELISFGSEYTRLSAHVRRETRPNVTIEMLVDRVRGRVVWLDKKKRSRLPDFVGQLNAVIFSSFDIEMVRGEPALRRRFLDLELSQISVQYLYALSRYKRALEQRNRALKLISIGRANGRVLDPLDEQLAEYGSCIVRRRQEFVERLGSRAVRAYQALSPGNEVLELAYNSSVEAASNDPDAGRRAVLASLAEKRDDDVRRGITSIGPHRDDMEMKINGVSVRKYASQGQQKSAALALRMAEACIVREAVGESPVLLLDDVCAELDRQRRLGALAFAAEGFQSFVTTTSLDELPVDALGEAWVFQVSEGTVTRR